MVDRVLRELERARKGIMLFHDIQPSTAQGLPRLLDELKSRGYRVVHLRPKTELMTLAAHDVAIATEQVPKSNEAPPHPLAKRTLTALAAPPPAVSKVKVKAPAPSTWNWRWDGR